MKLQKRDIELLKCLRANARLPLTQMSKKTKIPISTLFDKLKTHEKSTIMKHTTLVDFSRLGFHTKVQFYIRAPSSLRKQVLHYLASHPSINSLYRVNNGFQVLAEGIFTHMTDAESFIGHLEEEFTGLEYKTHYIIEEVKREQFFAS